MSLPLRLWHLLLVYLWYCSLYILAQSLLILMILYHSLPILPLVGVLILGLPLMSLLSSITCFLGYPVIVFGPFLMFTPFLLKDVRSCTLSSLMLLLVSLAFLLVHLLRFIRVVRNPMVCFSRISFVGFF